MGIIKKNNLVIIVMVLIVVFALVGCVFLKLQKNKTIEVEAVVKLIGDNYIIVEDSNGEEYSLETTGKYNVGDRIDFLIKNVDAGNPKTGTLVQINTISKNISFSIADGNNSLDDFVNEVEGDIGAEDNVIAYFTTLDNELDDYNQNKSIGDKLKDGFVKGIDFLFYDGEINGVTFDELSDSAKIRILELAFSIDEKIEKYFPGYKEKISVAGKKVYTSVKNKATELYFDITTSVCEYDPVMCENAKEGLKELKEKFYLTWDFIKEAGNSGLSKLKEWYEIWKTI